MVMDIGHYSGTPGFIKKYCAGVKRVLKRQNSKISRQRAKRYIDNDEIIQYIKPSRSGIERTRDYSYDTKNY